MRAVAGTSRLGRGIQPMRFDDLCRLGASKRFGDGRLPDHLQPYVPLTLVAFIPFEIQRWIVRRELAIDDEVSKVIQGRSKLERMS